MTLLNLPQATAPITKIHAAYYGDTILLTVIQGNPSYASVYAVYGNSATLLGRSGVPTGKVDSASSVADQHGNVRLYVSQADPGASGTTSKVNYYDFPLAIPPFVPSGSVDNFARNEIAALKAALVQAGNG